MGELDLKAQLEEAKRRKWDDRTLTQRSAELAQDLLNASLRKLKGDERTLLTALSRMATEEKYRLFVRELTTAVFHAATPAEQALHLRRLLTEHGGVPPIFSTVGKLRFKAAAMAANGMQQTAIAEVRRVFRSTFGELTLPTQVEKLAKRVREFAKDGMTPALNPMVPTVFGPKTAEQYFRNLEATLTKQEGVGLVIQPWRLVPHLSPYAPGHGARLLAEKLKELFRLSLKGGKARPLILELGESPLHPTVTEALRLSLSPAEFHRADVAIELPAYLRSTPAILRELTEWATARAAKGAQPLKVLLVKGSHLEQERENAFRYGEASPVCTTKGETEAAYKQLLHTAISAKPKAITPVIGSHNAFDLAYAVLDWARCGREGMPPICFLSGLANHLGRLLAEEGSRVTLCAGVSPTGDDSGFENHLMHLVSELSRPDGFIASGCALDTASLGWGRMRQHFLAAFSPRSETLNDDGGRDKQFRATPNEHIGDTDLIDSLYKAAEAENERPQADIPLLLNGAPVDTPLHCVSRSLSAPEMADYRFAVADYTAVDRCLALATQATAREPESPESRREAVLKVARALREQNAEFVALLVRDAGFTVADADAEVLAAADACRYYEWQAAQPGFEDGSTPSPLGVITVVPSRAHPLAEAVAGIAAAWITGNTIIYKPAFTSVLLGQRLTALLEEAGLRAPALQCLPCLDNQIADKLLLDPRVNAVIAHANMEHTATWTRLAPQRPLFGGTTGQNSVYLAAGCDWQAAIRTLIPGLFARSGQDATQPHLVLVHAALYDNQAFMNALRDAAGGFTALPGRTEGGTVATLARRPEGDEEELLRSDTKEGAWLVAPHRAESIDSLLYTPGVRVGIGPQSLFTLAAHNIPALGFIRVADTESAIHLQRELSRGMAAAIFSQDKTEIELWSRHIGTACRGINTLPARHPGTAPYGSNRNGLPLPGSCDFLSALCLWQETARPQHRAGQRTVAFTPWETLSPKPTPEETTRLSSAADSISYWWEKHFSVPHSLCKSPATETTMVYRPLSLCIRAEKAMSDIDLSIALMAALQAGCALTVSTPTMRPWMPRTLEPLGVPVVLENREQYENRFAALAADGTTVRDTAATEATLALAAEHHLRLCRASVLANARLELTRCTQAEITTQAV
ncbi:MAG: bifunctional proline dehydrogenase/L-glutamate gamma-semialdehyde dehydrogenase [Akkermansia sp.]|nr:bifunctional proline dehydrogenase/L-glutamate gamma-semialdehyde dehydrogenase [Akkermansia sp.]